jgi:F0F1-type ATP synthase membrane subunit b/b'
MKRDQTPRRAGPIAVCCAIAWTGALLLTPVAAFAEEGHGLVLLPELGRIAPLILLFVVLIPFSNALVLKPLLRVLDERDSRIGGTRAKADRLEHEAAEILARYERAVRETRDEGERARRTLLTEVRSEAQREIASARSDAETRLTGARGEIGASLETARGSLRGQAEDLARQAASQVLGRAL